MPDEEDCRAESSASAESASGWRRLRALLALFDAGVAAASALLGLAVLSFDLPGVSVTKGGEHEKDGKC